ncbi:MAG: hypothetical protein CTY34_12490 [Methylobacter sp.]|nr:MAG: hypothetical protein CTY34_12490 [Methylobacter sp.]PPD36249.1 MAG: hypothetical protein CTY18_05275 [Methylomonas sp.]
MARLAGGIAHNKANRPPITLSLIGATGSSSAAAATGQQKGVYAAVKSIAPFDPLLSDGRYYFLKKEIVMNFVYEEWLSETDTEKANALAKSVGENDHVFQWVIDRESEVVLICFALSSRMMQGPGKYGLFIKGRGLTFKVKYTRGVNEEGVHGLINVFDKLSLEIPDDLAMPREVIIQLIKEALYVLGMSMTSTALVRVNIE